MEDNEITIHLTTGYILLDGEGTDESSYQFLELQMDDDKRTIETAPRYSGPLRGFLNNYLTLYQYFRIFIKNTEMQRPDG